MDISNLVKNTITLFSPVNESETNTDSNDTNTTVNNTSNNFNPTLGLLTLGVSVSKYLNSKK